MQSFRELSVWKKAHRLVLEIYQSSRRFPAEERYGLTAQLRRAAASVPTNIAEGSKRKSRSEYARFLNIAESSLAETQYLLILAADLGYMDESLQPTADEVARMLHGLRESVEHYGR